MFNTIEEIYYTLIGGGVLLLFFCCFIIFIIIRHEKKHRIHLLEKHQLQSQFQQTLLQSQLEIQEQTLKNISQEIHDNIGQMLSLAKINLGTTNIEEPETAKDKIDNAHQLVSKSIVDLRNLSRSLDTDHISEKGLQASIAFELELIEKTGNHKTIIETSGNSVNPDKQKELILFRIIQECLHNIIKHAQATEIKVAIENVPGQISISITDNGKGFNVAGSVKGLGLRNMENRSKLIGAAFSINSVPGNGTQVKILLPI